MLVFAEVPPKENMKVYHTKKGNFSSFWTTIITISVRKNLKKYLNNPKKPIDLRKVLVLVR